MAELDRAGDYKHLTLLGEGALSAAVTLQHPGNQLLVGFIPKTHLFGPTAAALRYNCLPRAAACGRNLNDAGTPTTPRGRFYDDLGMVAPSSLIHSALETFASCDYCPGLVLKQKKSRGRPEISF